MVSKGFLVIVFLIGATISGFVLNPYQNTVPQYPIPISPDTLKVFQFSGRTDEYGRVDIPHGMARDCKGLMIVGITAAIQHKTNKTWYVPGDDDKGDFRTFYAWGDDNLTAQISDENWAFQDVTFLVFAIPDIC